MGRRYERTCRVYLSAAGGDAHGVQQTKQTQFCVQFCFCTAYAPLHI